MWRRLAVFAAVCSLGCALSGPVRAQDKAPAQGSPPAEAKSLMQAAQQKARKQHKPLMVLFDASW
jgi:hypothetical protein